MKKIAAVFDIDGTILKENSTWIFFKYLYRMSEIKLRDTLNYDRFLLKTLFKDPALAIKGNKHFLKDKPYLRINNLAAECFEQNICPLVLDGARKQIEFHRKAGHELTLLSGTLDILLKLFQEHLKIEKGIGAELEVVGGNITGNLKNYFPYGSKKADIARVMFDPQLYDLSNSFSYANSGTDIEMLKLFGHPALVNPAGRKARAVAGKEKITIMEF